MEPFPKRQRLYAPMERSFPQSFDDQHAYYDELGDDLMEDEEEYGEEEEPESGYDPEAELEQKRARLDYKLKSTFESIFEKYERDFDGVGDEIDLETGEIVVNNGHIVQMLDEQDAGDTSRARQALREYTQEPDELPSSSFDDTEIMDDDEEEEDDEDELMSDEDIVEDDMAEDDMILRGFAKANRFQQGSPELGISNAPIAPERVRRQEPVPRPVTLPRPVQAKPLPSRADILAQFGPQLGPQIVEYVSHQRVAEERHVEPSWRAPELPKTSAARNIEPAWRTPALPSAAPRRVEPAWRVPDLPSAAPVRRPLQNPIVMLPEEERSPSPEAAASIWAPVRPRGRRRLDGADNSALFRGESRAPFHGQKSKLDPLSYRSTHDTAQRAQVSSPKKKRFAFTAEEDDLLLEWVSKLRRHGHALTKGRWKEFEAENPQHPAASWQQRYVRKFTYLSTDQVEESDLSNSEVSLENLVYQPPPAVRRTEPQYDSPRERPCRIRKPAQTDPRILSWNQAVDSIESVDPILHAGIMEDARRANNEPPHSSSRQQEHQVVEDSGTDTPHLSQETTPPAEIRRSYDDLPIRSSLAVELTPEQEDFLIPGAPCPHAECKLYPTILYKLQRREHEELSEMCLHLFQVHHTTPFPCGEIGCSKKGEDGYFMQLDLVKHVRLAHKSVSALHRLRGRVDSTLLDQPVAISRPAPTSDPMQRPVSQHRDSDFMSPLKGHARNLSSSQPSSFDPNQTLTPRAIAGLATFTPMTSVSSLKVNHPSATSLSVRDMSNSQDGTILDSLLGSSQFASSQPRVERQPVIQSEGSFQRLSPPPNSESSLRDVMGIPQTLTGKSIEMPALAMTRPVNDAQEQILEPHDTIQASVEALPEVSMPSIPKPVVQQSAFEGASSSIPGPSTNAVLPISRNIVDPTYEFSDEEPEMRPPISIPTQEVSTPKQAPKQRAKVPLVPASVSSRPPASMPVSKAVIEPPVSRRSGALKAVAKPLGSPVSKAQVPKSVPKSVAGPSGTRPKSATKPVVTPAAKTHQRDHSEGIDELSLGVDEFILLSSRQRTNPLPVPQLGIKHEELVDSPALLSIPAARKRKLDAICDNGFDELSVLAQNTSIAQLAIKTETDEPSLPLNQPTMPKRKGRPPRRDAAESSSSQIRSSHVPDIMLAATSTPLLDLTPVRNARVNAERMKEIGDSEEEEGDDPESPSHRPKQRPRGQTAHPVDFGNMTPITKSRWNRDSLKAEQVSVLVKTPGGTMRRCGVDGFECKRSFCFRCSTNGLDQVV
ncbi:hypothetical protein BKA65DRAFT_541508 [Rhexocercosporidium sp. MPI-PUGE-AT-0058]|nr:hypothetical protein BKA65DRAFT_541508 [Rhexocercosporidium sp. MPI-PUGE-AT-0058]